MSFDEIFDLTAGVYFELYNTYTFPPEKKFKNRKTYAVSRQEINFHVATILESIPIRFLTLIFFRRKSVFR